MATCKWNTPLEWLESEFSEGNISAEDLMAFIRSNADSDQLQDYFQDLMDQDGYFNDLDEIESDDDFEDDDDPAEASAIANSESGYIAERIVFIADATRPYIGHVYLYDSDFDYDWEADQNVYPFDTTTY